MKRNACQILERLHWFTGGMHQNDLVIPGWTPFGWWEMDFCRITKAGVIYEYETKVSWADFLADFEKRQQFSEKTGEHSYQRRYFDLGKHEILNDPAHQARRVPHYFSFAVCPTILPKVEPFLTERYPKYGLYSWQSKEYDASVDNPAWEWESPPDVPQWIEVKKTRRFFAEIRKPQRINPKDGSPEWAASFDRKRDSALRSMSYRFWDLKLQALRQGMEFSSVHEGMTEIEGVIGGDLYEI